MDNLEVYVIRRDNKRLARTIVCRGDVITYEDENTIQFMDCDSEDFTNCDVYFNVPSENMFFRGGVVRNVFYEDELLETIQQ